MPRSPGGAVQHALLYLSALVYFVRESPPLFYHLLAVGALLEGCLPLLAAGQGPETLLQI